jgi:hypothetical protein
VVRWVVSRECGRIVKEVGGMTRGRYLDERMVGLFEARSGGFPKTLAWNFVVIQNGPDLVPIGDLFFVMGG